MRRPPSRPHTAACDPGLHIGEPVKVAPNRAREFHRVQVPISYPGASGGLAHAQHLGQLLFVDQKPLVGWNGGCLAGMVGQCYGHADASYQVSLSAAPVSGKDSWAAIAFVELATLLYVTLRRHGNNLPGFTAGYPQGRRAQRRA